MECLWKGRKLLQAMVGVCCLLVFTCQSWALSKKWDTKADWDSGTKVSLETTKNPGQMEIFYDPNAVPVIKTEFTYIPISNRNQVIKMRLSDGKIMWTFNLGALGVGSNPSRTVIDAKQNLWVGMRQGAWVVAISPDGKFLGKAQVGNGPTGTRWVRAVAFDGDGFVWAGTYQDQFMVKIDPNTYSDPVNKIFKIVAKVGRTDVAAGLKVPVDFRPYGAVVAKDGNIWVSSRSGAAWATAGLVRIDTKTNKITGMYPGIGAYGIGADRLNNVWLASWDYRQVYQYSTSGTLIKTHAIGDNARGVMIGPNQRLWVANSYGPDRITRIDPKTGAFLRVDNLGPHMIGLGTDSAGFMWAISYNDGYVYKVNATTGAKVARYPLCEKAGVCANTGCQFCANGNPTGFVYAYTYSDMTGYQLLFVITPAKATWTVPFEPKCKANFANVVWKGTIPAKTTVSVAIRTASTRAGLATAKWTAFVGSGQPLNATPGEFSEIQFQLTTNDSRTTPTVTEADLSYSCFPEVAGTPPPTATEDSQYTYSPPLGDLDLPSDSHSWKAKKLPTGAKIDPNTGKVTWTPGDADINKSHDMEIEVCDKNGNCTNKTWKVNVLNINDLPVIVSKNPTEATEDKELTYQVKATDVDPGDEPKLTYKLTTNNPAGAKIDSTGKITWTPGDADVTAGKRTFEVEVCDPNGGCTKQKYEVKVNNVNDNPSIDSKPPVTAEEDKQYTYTPKGSDVDPGDEPKLKWKLKTNPPGAKIDPKTGEVTWTPGDKDSDKPFDFEIEVCDPNGACSTQKWQVTPKNVNDAPIIKGTPPVESYVGEAISYKPTVEDADPKDTHTWSLKKGPPGAKVDPKTGELTWTPAGSEANTSPDVEIEVCDDGNPKLCATQTFKIPVKLKCTVDTDCGSKQICVDQKLARVCVDPGCSDKDPRCKDAVDYCVDDQCQKDPCDGKLCAPGEICRPSDGKCISPCAGVQCKTDQTCVDGKCTQDPCSAAGAPCKADELCVEDPKNKGKHICTKNPCQTGSCKGERVCLGGKCATDPCEKMKCPDRQQRCVAGQCIDRQDCATDLNCPGDEVCLGGKCYPPGCYAKGAECPSTQRCIDGVCKEDLCKGTSPKQCNPDEYCRSYDNQCVRSCNGVTCPSGEFCEAGVCKKDPCARVTCQAGKVCVAGDCTKDNCNASNTCKHGRQCNPNLSACQDDPCAGVKCPDSKQVCKWGQCVPPDACKVDSECPAGRLCVKGSCVISQCNAQKPCPNGKICQDGECLGDPCSGVQCKDGEYCKGGQCVGSCAGVFCKQGEVCVDGKCSGDPCAGKQCPAGEVCVSGNCVKDTCTKDSCRDGRLCIEGRCVQDPCKSIVCTGGQICKDGQCMGDRTCDTDSECPGGGVCVDKKCVPSGCYAGTCSGAKICLKAQCTDNPCDGKTCAAGETCRPTDGKCVKGCEACDVGKRCVDGACVADPCAGVTCNPGERCEEGKCVADPCNNAGASLCRYKRACNKNSCHDDSCAGVKCPADATCRDGVCITPKKPDPEPEPTVDAGAPDQGTVIDREIAKDTGAADKPPLLASGGCGCSTSGSPFSGGLMFGFFLLLLASITRRKQLR